MRKINFYKWVCDWGVAEKDYQRHALSLGFLYFAELFAYQAFSLLPNGESFAFLKGNDWVTLALHVGMLLGAIGWCWWVLFKKGLTYGRALKRSVGFYTLALAWIVAMSVTIALGQWRVGDYFTAWLFAIARFLFGAGFSAGLGLTVVFVAEVFPRYLRTRAATLACAIGFTGPLVAAGCYWALLCFPATSDWPGTATLAIGLVLAIWSWWGIGRHMLQVPFNKEFFVFERKPRAAEALRNVRNTVFAGKSSTIFWSAAFMGISISLFSDLLHLLPRMNAYRGVINPDFVFACRYASLASGSLWAGWQSWRQHSRQRVISQMLFLQVVALFSLLLLPIAMNKWGPTPINELDKWFCGATLILSGWANSNWIVMLLHTFEQFGKGQRAVAVLLAINVYRFGSIGLIGLNLLHPDWFNHFEFALLGLGLVYIGVGLVASRQLADNFEGDALESDYDPAARPLSGGEIRQKLLEIPEKAWNSEAEGQFLEQVSGILYERMSDTLRENYYLSTLYFAQESDARLGSAGNYHTREETFGLRGLDKNGATDFHTIGEKFIEQGVFSSLSLWLEKNDALDGLLLWYGGPGQHLDRSRLRDAAQNGQGRHFKTLDISKIQLPDNWREYHERIFLGGIERPWEERRDALEALEKVAVFDEFEMAEIDAGMRRNLLFQRLEAEARYRPGLLFVYYIKPHPTKYAHLRGILFLKMADQLSQSHLTGLRAILTWVLLQRAAALLRRSNNLIVHKERHANWHELNTLVERLSNVGHWFKAQHARFEDAEVKAFEQEFNPALQTIEHLRALNEYYAFMVKAGNRPSEDVEERYENLIKTEPLSLHEALLREVENMKKNPSIVGVSSKLSDAERRHIALKCLSELEKSIEQIFENQTININTNKIALRVVLHELLKNAARHAHRFEPQLSVSWENPSAQRGDCAALHFHNNWNERFGTDLEAQQKFVETIRDGIEHSHRSLGIRSVRRFVGLPYFSTAPWQLSCEDPRTSDATQTDIFLLIPHQAVQVFNGELNMEHGARADTTQ